ncbi:hypothetical protein [Fibrobacter sp. UWB11]|uniref:hypothetical protein n=1 Tax=Fibrobacter sp. UWB11 TaxID=1896202 RepID=UPI000929902F|nr:hypothetical protein [Fibrobacter sp. UWB11]SIN91283.1 hypothetical protein SAMN05720758_0547 [Fibrobacter sp. UWB11]
MIEEKMAEEEMNKAFRYYNYVREFYGYLCDSLDLVFEDDCCEFDPAYAPAEKEFPPAEGIDENSTAKAIALDKMARAIRAYETMRTIVAVLDKDGVEKSANNRGMMQDPHKFALTSIGEYFPTTTLWREFEEPAQKRLGKYADDAQSAIMLMEPLSLESAIHNIFAEQKECLEKFLPQKIEELKKLQAEMESFFDEKNENPQNLHRRQFKYEDRRSQEYINSIMESLIKDDGWIGARKKCKLEEKLHQDMQLLARKALANARFEHRKENIDKLLLLNKRLHELQDECAKVTFDMYRDMRALMAQGKSYYKTFGIESFIVYESEEDWEGDVSGLYDSYDRANRFQVNLNDAPGKEPADYKDLNAWHEELSWNIEGLDLPEFKDEYICFAMHKFFADGSYSLEDAMRMKLEEFYVHTEIHI